jgi:hypothetical protein
VPEQRIIYDLQRRPIDDVRAELARVRGEQAQLAIEAEILEAVLKLRQATEQQVGATSHDLSLGSETSRNMSLSSEASRDLSLGAKAASIPFTRAMIDTEPVVTRHDGRSVIGNALAIVRQAEGRAMTPAEVLARLSEADITTDLNAVRVALRRLVERQFLLKHGTGRGSTYSAIDRNVRPPQPNGDV